MLFYLEKAANDNPIGIALIPVDYAAESSKRKPPSEITYRELKNYVLTIRDYLKANHKLECGDVAAIVVSQAPS